MDKLTELREKFKAAVKAARDIAAQAEQDNRDFTDEERATVQSKMDEAKAHQKELKKLEADGAVRQALKELGDDVGMDSAKRNDGPTQLHTLRGKSLGEHFTASAEYRDLLTQAPGGQFSKQHRIATRPVGYDRLLGTAGRKALVTGVSDTSAGAFVVNDQLGTQVGLDAFARPLTLRSLVTGGTTTSDTVEYVRLTATTNAAAPVAEATTTANGTKPESGLTTAKVTAPVKTIAHWIPVTKRALSDAAQIRTLIDNFLDYGLEEELEDQMISGDGTGENFTGLAATSGVQTAAWDTDLLTTTRKAKTLVRTVGRSIATGWALNPTDVEALDLLRDGQDRFYFGGPSGGAPAAGGLATMLWGLPVIETDAVPVGTGYVGDWRKAIIWDREQASITMSDSHANFFVQNLVAILAEMRAAFGIVQPSAFVEIDLTAL